MENDIKIKTEKEPRKTVEIILPDGRVLSGPRGATLETFLKALPEWDDMPIVGAIINSELRELTYPVQMDAKVKPLNIIDSDGARIYRRSVTFLLQAAFEELFADAALSVDYSVPTGGFYCEFSGHKPLSIDDLARLEKRMREMVSADLKLERHQVPLTQALEYFRGKGQLDKYHLLRYRAKEYLILYKLENHQDYHHGYMVPSTGYLRWFDLRPMGEGFVVRFPRRHSPKELLPLPKSDNLVKTFKQYGDWLERIGIPNVGALNDAIDEKRIHEVILVSEALHEQKISDIATQILKKKNKVRIVLIAGPSSSGKTTFSKRLALQVLAQGGEPFALEMDNFFVDRENTPRDDEGQYDFECLDAVNRSLLSKCIHQLIRGEEVILPRYDFKAGKSQQGDVTHLSQNQVILLEGIHGLNPDLLIEVSKETMYRIYVSCLTQLNLDRYNRISTTDTRLLRRIVRDANERGYNASQTIQRWDSVRRGERKYIFPYQDFADEVFNSALVYELSVLKPFAEPLLRQVPFGTPEYIEAKRLLAFLEWFLPAKTDLIPDNSILREFIGESILKDFRIWKKTSVE